MRTTLDPHESVVLVKPRSENWLGAYILNRYSRWWMAFLLLLSDLISLFLSGVLAEWIRVTTGGSIQSIDRYIRMFPMLVVFIMIYAFRGLYPAVGISPVEELRKLTLSTGVVFILFTGFTFWARSAENYSRLFFAYAWIISSILVQANRWILRIIAVRMGVWGEPIAIIGAGNQAKRTVNFLVRNYRFGFKPTFVIDGDPGIEYQKKAFPVPIIHYENYRDSHYNGNSSTIKTAIMITNEIPEAIQREIVDEQILSFKRIILISDLRWIGSLGVVAYDLEGFVGLEVRQNLFTEWQQGLKRLLDIVLVLLGSVLLCPMIALISLIIRLDSSGPIFYGHMRLGKAGKKIKVWKFRTMVPNADEALLDYLDGDQQLRQEWVKTQKLKDDPRVTKIGKLLRKLSLDELPQFWNVLKGDMSIVGPRPIVEDEIKHYNDRFTLYTRVRPGVTGLWQVSGRNDVGYDSRVRFDEYYVRNWSIWLDFYIMLRTLWVVVRKNGAY